MRERRAAKFEFEKAAALRDKIRALKRKNVGMLFQALPKAEPSSELPPTK